jgi:hypothetical protein
MLQTHTAHGLSLAAAGPVYTVNSNTPTATATATAAAAVIAAATEQ